ncbi:UNVERIFIED_ORG: hypothetical protein M2328_003841 [Rhodococcus erythropolis]|jgi:hypothetical protein
MRGTRLVKWTFLNETFEFTGLDNLTEFEEKLGLL